MISRPRVNRSAITFTADVTDCGVSPDPCSALFVVALVVGSYLVTFGLVFGFTQITTHGLGGECPAG